MNVLYDSEGYEYPVDDYGQIYVPLEAEQTVAKTFEEEKPKETKNKKGLMLSWPLLVPLLAQLVWDRKKI